MLSSPFKAAHNNVKNIYFLSDGQRFPALPWEIDYSLALLQQWVDPYTSLFQDELRADSGSEITLADYPKEFCYYKFVFGQFRCEPISNFNPKLLGSARLTVEFSAPTTTTLKLLVFTGHNKILSLDNLRNVHRPYQM